MQPSTATIIKDELLALGKYLSEYSDARHWASLGNDQPKSEKDYKQAIEDQEEVVIFQYEQAPSHDLWKLCRTKRKLDFFRIRVISLLASHVATGSHICPPILDVVHTCRWGVGHLDLDSSLQRIVDMRMDDVLFIEERMPPYLISSGVQLSAKAMETFASKTCLIRPSEIPVPERKRKAKRKAPDLTPSCPKDLYDQLRKYVIGQDAALRTLATRGFLHITRAQMLRAGKNVGKNECLMIGGTSGSGKTFMCERFGALAGIPFASISNSEFTGTGFVGQDVCCDALNTLIRHPLSQGNAANARYSCCFFDEIDKKRGHGDNRHHVSTTAVQQEMLRLIEGTELTLGHTYRMAQNATFNSNGTMFVLAGAMEGFDQVIQKRKKHGHSIGFGAQEISSSDSSYLVDALVDYGFIRELCNRLTGVLWLNPLSIEALQRIIVGQRGVIASINEQLTPMKLTIALEDQAVAMIAEAVHEAKTLVRGAHAIIDSMIESAVFSGIEGRITFTESDVENALHETMVVG